MTKDLTKWLAFTLAEVLITLAIIGVVAGLTIPSLLANTNEKGLNTADSVFQRRLGEALKIMNLQGTLAGQPSTKAFVDELGRHMKITKVCSEENSTPLTDCFVSEFQSGDETIEISKLKESKNLYSTTNYDTKTVGVVFGNGTRALIAYNPKATQDQFNNSNEEGSPVRLTTSGSGKQTLVSLDSDALSILYILQDRKNNNIFDNTKLNNKANIRGINISFGLSNCNGYEKDGACYVYLGYMTWNEANEACSSIISKENLQSLVQDQDMPADIRSSFGGGMFWVYSSGSGNPDAISLSFMAGQVEAGGYSPSNSFKVVCVENQ